VNIAPQLSGPNRFHIASYELQLSPPLYLKGPLFDQIDQPYCFMAHIVLDPRPAFRPSKDFEANHKTTQSHPRPVRPRNKVETRGSESESSLNESSPLLSPEPSDNERLTGGGSSPPSGVLDWNEGDEEQSKSVWYLFLLTLSIGG